MNCRWWLHWAMGLFGPQPPAHPRMAVAVAAQMPCAFAVLAEGDWYEDDDDRRRSHRNDHHLIHRSINYRFTEWPSQMYNNNKWSWKKAITDPLSSSSCPTEMNSSSPSTFDLSPSPSCLSSNHTYSCQYSSVSERRSSTGRRWTPGAGLASAMCCSSPPGPWSPSLFCCPAQMIAVKWERTKWIACANRRIRETHLVRRPELLDTLHFE